MRREEPAFQVDLDETSVVLRALRLDLDAGALTGSAVWHEGDDLRRTGHAIPFAFVRDVRPFTGAEGEIERLNAAFAAHAERWQVSDQSPPRLVPGRRYQARLENGQVYAGTLLQTMVGPNGQQLLMFELADGARMALNKEKVVLSQ